MKHLLLVVFLVSHFVSWSQWSRVAELPAKNIHSLYHDRNILYAGGQDKIYIGKENGNSWDSSAIILPGSTEINVIISFKGWLYAASWDRGVFRSNDNGKTWLDAGAGLFPRVNEFCEWHGNLYAATLGDGIYRLDPATTNSWTRYSDGISSQDINCNSIAGNSQVMVTSGSHNGVYNRLEASGGQWEEKFITGNIRPGMLVNKIIVANDSFFLSSGPPNLVFRSTDNGVSWQLMGPNRQFNDHIITTYMNILNARQAVLLARNIFTVINAVQFYLKYKNAPLADPWIKFDSLPFFTYAMQIAGTRLWVASTEGLFYIPLQRLPGITPFDNPNYTFSVGPVYPNPTRDDCNVTITLEKAARLSARLYDALGRLVAIIAADRPLDAGPTTTAFNMNRFAAGLYFLQLVIDDKVVVRKIVASR